MSRAEVIEIRDVPTSRVESVVRDFHFEGLTDVAKVQQPNGMWTVRANSSSLSSSKPLRAGRS